MPNYKDFDLDIRNVRFQGRIDDRPGRTSIEVKEQSICIVCKPKTGGSGSGGGSKTHEDSAW